MGTNKEKTGIVLFNTDDGKIKIDVLFEEETVWLSQEQMAQLFEKGRSTITEHIGNVYEEGELEQNRTCRNFRQVRKEGVREVVREKGTLIDAGKISHEKAIEKAKTEYQKYQVKTLSPVEKAYLETIIKVQKEVEQKSRKQ